MVRASALLLAATLLVANTAAAQVTRSRSADYLFVGTADDGRALWLNPAGLGVVPEASVMGELVLDRPVGGDLRVGQYTVSFNSRGLGFGYQRDRLLDGTNTDAFRFAASLPFRNGALGGSFTLYRNGNTESGGNIGIRYRFFDALDGGAVLRNIGRPTLRGVTYPLVIVAGVGWAPPSKIIEVAAEAHLTERLTESGYDGTYRAGAHVTIGGRIPIGAIAAFDLGSNFKIDAMTFGITVGGANRGILLGSVVPTGGSVRFERFSLTGFASRGPPTRRP